MAEAGHDATRGANLGPGRPMLDFTLRGAAVTMLLTSAPPNTPAEQFEGDQFVFLPASWRRRMWRLPLSPAIARPSEHSPALTEHLLAHERQRQRAHLDEAIVEFLE